VFSGYLHSPSDTSPLEPLELLQFHWGGPLMSGWDSTSAQAAFQISRRAYSVLPHCKQNMHHKDKAKCLRRLYELLKLRCTGNKLPSTQNTNNLLTMPNILYNIVFTKNQHKNALYEQIKTVLTRKKYGTPYYIRNGTTLHRKKTCKK
jgi:hypothetical protein